MELDYTDLPPADNADRATDLLSIYDTSASRLEKITVNILLGLSSAPVGLTDTQTLTNKTFTAPTVNDAVLGGTITGTYTLGGTPTFPSSVATLTGTQTLTNKTLTSPTINTPTISNPTITTDSISEHTTANGVVVDGVTLKDGAVGEGNVVPNSLVSNTGTSWAWQSWTPTLGNITVGNGTLIARYCQMGKTVHFQISIKAGSTSSASSSPRFSLPVTISSNYIYVSDGNANNGYIGEGHLVNASTNSWPIHMRIYDYNTLFIIRPAVTGSSIATAITDLDATASPFQYSTNDIITAWGTYEAA